MDAKQVLALIKEKDVKFVDFRFTDPRGKWQHTARMASATDESSFVDGVMFDGSSIAGWKAINESDMTLMPDPTTAIMDPFFSAPTMSIGPDTGYAGTSAGPLAPGRGSTTALCPHLSVSACAVVRATMSAPAPGATLMMRRKGRTG